MTILSQYRDIVGKPIEGIHAHRVAGFATVDVGLTVLLTLLPTWALHRWARVPYLLAFVLGFVGLILLAIFIHYIFGVRTRLNTLLGVAPAEVEPVEEKKEGDDFGKFLYDERRRIREAHEASGGACVVDPEAV